MNHEAVSQICFAQSFEVLAHQTARAVFANLPFGAGYAVLLADVLSTAQLLAHLESICMDAMHHHIDWPSERVLGTSMKLDHCGAATVGERIEVSGFVTGLGDRSVQFHVRACSGAREVAQGSLSFTLVTAAWQPRARRTADYALA